MSRVQLSDFPTGAWESGQRLPALASAQAHFLQALQLQPNQRTANHRLGLLALERRDFIQVAAYLETALQSSPGHRGIRKTLGYTYTWLGNYDQALELLKTIPEAGQEMQVYVWWWGEQGRPDLSTRAAEMAKRLGP